jgi:hypothetical protein
MRLAYIAVSLEEGVAAEGVHLPMRRMTASRSCLTECGLQSHQKQLNQSMTGGLCCPLDC